MVSSDRSGVNQCDCQEGNLTHCMQQTSQEAVASDVESQVMSHLILHWWGLRQMMEEVGHFLLQTLW